MGKFAELREQYVHSDKQYRDYEFLSRQFVRWLSDKLGNYIEAPESYQMREDDKASHRKAQYTWPVEAKHGGDGELIFNVMRRNKTLPELIWDEDGRWIAGVGLTLDVAPECFPKMTYQFPIWFTIEDRIAMVSVSDADSEIFQFNIDDEDGPNKLFDKMVSILEVQFAAPPWQTVKRRSIGFIGHIDS